MLQERAIVGLVFEILPHCGILAAMRLQLRHKVRIRQKANIEKQIRSGGNSMLEAEAHHRHHRELVLGEVEAKS